MNIKIVIVVLILLLLAVAGFAIKYYLQRKSPNRKKRYMNTFWNARRKREDSDDA